MPDIIQEDAPITINPSEGGVSTTFADPPASDDSLASHIEEFHEPPQKADATPAEPEKPKGRHRAAKDRARPEDVPRIQALSAEVKEWKAKYEAAIASGSTPKQATTAANQPATRPSEPPKAVPEKFSFDSFEAYAQKHPEIQPAEMWDAWEADKLDARDEWKAAKHLAQTETARQQEDQTKQEQAIAARANKYTEQLTAYVKANPERQAAFQNIPQVPPLLLETIWAMDNGPDVVYMLTQTPGLFAEARLNTDGRPVSAQNVALTTEWLEARVKAGTTGAVTRGSNSSPAPRPPTPVRTTPMPPPSAPPGETSSLLEHNSFFKTAR